jgi:hypothetical protein
MRFFDKNDYSYQQAKRRERYLRKRWKSGERIFLTGNKKSKIVILNINQHEIEFASELTQKPIKMNRRKFRLALWHMFFYRTAIRKDLERYHHFTSALFALVEGALADIVKIQKTAKGLLRLTLKAVRYFFAGLETSPQDRILIKSLGGRFILLSYYHLRHLKNEKWKEHVQSLGLKVLLDSGAFSLMKAKRDAEKKPTKKPRDTKPITLEEYASFVMKHKDDILGYFNLDVENDIVSTRLHQKELTARIGQAPIPVWHLGMGWSELDRLVQEDHPLIGIGGTVFMDSTKEKRAFFDELFRRYPDQPFHWLGGSSYLLQEYPFFSADSTGWNIGRQFRRLIPMYRPQMDAPEDWSPLDALSYNIRQLIKLEEAYDFVQWELPLPA